MRSLQSRLNLLVRVAIALLMVIGAVGIFNTYRQTQAGEELVTDSKVLRAQMQADMLHDTIRADVLNAMRLAADKEASDADKQAVVTDLREHSQSFKEQLSFVEKQGAAEVKTILTTLQSDLNSYLKTADLVVQNVMKQSSDVATSWTNLSRTLKRSKRALKN